MRFSLRELSSDNPVGCHPDPGFDDRLSNASGQIADVTGTITRDAATGRAISIGKITRIETVKEGDPMGYLLARGALRLREPAEETVRRVRDATR